jgi:hypothetical protein
MNLARANHIPEEVLAQILLEGELPSFPSTTDEDYAPLQVCRSWRKTALGSSELWTHIDINLVYECYIEEASSKLPGLPLWLRRSKNRPLTIRLEIIPPVKRPDSRRDHMLEDARIMEGKIMARLLSVSPRWGDVTIEGTHRDFVYLYSALPEAVRLKTLTLRYVENEEGWVEQQHDPYYRKPFFHLGLQGPDPFHIPRLTTVCLDNIMFYCDTTPPFIAHSVTSVTLERMRLRLCDLQAVNRSFPSTETLLLNDVGDSGHDIDACVTLPIGFSKLRELRTLDGHPSSQKFLHAIIRSAPLLFKLEVFVEEIDIPHLSKLTHVESLAILIMDGNPTISLLPSALRELRQIREIRFAFIAGEGQTSSLRHALRLSGAPILQLLAEADESGVLLLPSLRSIELEFLPFWRVALVEMARIRFAHAAENAADLRILIKECFALPDINARSFEDFQKQLNGGETVSVRLASDILHI